MLWINYLLKFLFIIWLLLLGVIDVRIKKVPFVGLMVAVTIAIGGAINRVCGVIIENRLAVDALKEEVFSINDFIGIVIGILPGVFLIFLSFATKKVGLADGILMCCIGLFENYMTSVIIFCTASFIMAIFSIVMLILKKVRRNSPLPYIPFLTLGYLLNMMLFFLYI